MQRFHDLPIKRKLIVIVMVTSTLAVLLACAGLSLYDLSVFRKQMEREVRTLARVIEENSTAPLAFNDPVALQEVLSSLAAVPSIKGAAVYSADSTRFAGYVREGEERALPEFAPAAGSFPQGRDLYHVRPIVLNGNTMGTLFLRSSLSRWYDRVAQYAGIAAVVLLLSCAGAFILAARLQRSISAPIRHLAEVSRQVSQEGDYTVRAHVQSRDELGQLTRAFNRMLAQIQGRDAALVEAKEEAEEMARLKSAFLNNMSHEIRTPLAGIIGFAEILAEQVPEEQQDFAETIQFSAKRLKETLTSVLKLAELESGRPELDAKVIDVAEEAESVVSLFRQFAEQKGLDMYFHSLSGSPFAFLDPAGLNRILNNLIGNAIKFTEEGYVAVEVEADGQNVHLRVKDTGIGIGDAFMEHLFDEFKQESTGLARSHEGTGLGLAITERLVGLMNGTIEVESRKEIGSTFTVTFPQFNSSDSKGQPEESDQLGYDPRITKRRILIVEDNAEMRSLLERRLGPYHDVCLTEDPFEALEAIQAGRFDAFILDINLGTPQNGVSLLQAFRSQPDHRETPALALTAYAIPGGREALLDAGFDSYLGKPFSKEHLLEKVDQLFAPTGSLT